MTFILTIIAQLAGTVKYTDCTYTEVEDPAENCPGNDTKQVDDILPESSSSIPKNDSKQYDNDVPVMLELWGMRSTPSLPSLRGQLWLGLVAPDWVLSMGQVELKFVLMLN